uniref:ORF28 n=1 Tax=Caenorhabditis tropicalis TaxID=1561998 RepID=A0A1I7T569_9PELO
MNDRRNKTNRENINSNGNGKITETPFVRRPPIVSKIDGRARILRPLRQNDMISNQQPTTSSNTGGNIGRNSSSGNMHHSQSMPVLQSGNTGSRSNPQSSSRPTLTFPSNTTEKNVVPLLQWAEAMKFKLDKLKQKSKKCLDLSLQVDLSLEDLEKAKADLTELANLYYDMNRASVVKCRYNAVFDKKTIYKSVESAIQDLKIKDVSSYSLFDQLQQSMDEKSLIERNILAVAETFRQNAVFPPHRSRLSAPPPITFSKHVEEANKGFATAMDAVVNRTRGDTMSWRFKRISHQCFRNSKSLVEVLYSVRRPSSDKEFVTCMKALLILKYGILEDLIIGGEDESLYDTEKIYHSKRKVYQEFTKSAREIILCSSVTKFTTPNNVVACNNYIQSYVNCFSNKCYYCKKLLRQMMPPTMVTRESSPIICHKLCLMSQAL